MRVRVKDGQDGDQRTLREAGARGNEARRALSRDSQEPLETGKPPCPSHTQPFPSVPRYKAAACQSCLVKAACCSPGRDPASRLVSELG